MATKEKAVKLRPLRTILIISAVTAAAVLAWMEWKMVERHALIGSSLPARPALAAWPAELTREIAAAESEAKSYRHSAAGLETLGRLYHANGFYNEAMQCYAALQGIAPTDAHWPYFQSSILADFGRLEEARPFAERAVRLAPTYLPAHLRLAEVLFKSNQTAAAAKSYQEVAQRESGNVYALLGLAKCDIAKGDWTTARDRLRAALKIDPDFIGALSLLVTVSEHFDDRTEAAALNARIGKKEFVDYRDPWLESLFDVCYDPYRLSVAASMANFAGDLPAARRWLERAIGLAPKAGTYCRQLGDILLQGGKLPEARKYLERAVELTPGDSDAWSLLATLFTAANDPAAAMRTLIAGLAQCPQSAALHHAYGEKLAAAGRDAEAIVQFQAAKHFRPNEANAYMGLALVYFRNGRVEEAVAELRGALAVQPGHPLALEVLARYAIDNHDEPAARHWIEQLRQQPRVPAQDMQAIVGEYQNQFGRRP